MVLVHLIATLVTVTVTAEQTKKRKWKRLGREETVHWQSISFALQQNTLNFSIMFPKRRPTPGKLAEADKAKRMANLTECLQTYDTKIIRCASTSTYNSGTYSSRASSHARAPSSTRLATAGLHDNLSEWERRRSFSQCSIPISALVTAQVPSIGHGTGGIQSIGRFSTDHTAYTGGVSARIVVEIMGHKLRWPCDRNLNRGQCHGGRKSNHGQSAYRRPLRPPRPQRPASFTSPRPSMHALYHLPPQTAPSHRLSDTYNAHLGATVLTVTQSILSGDNNPVKHHVPYIILHGEHPRWAGLSTHEMVTMGTCAVCKSNSNRDTGGKWMTGGRAHLAASPTEDSGANIPLAHEAPEPAR
ncbi:hypothetical protein V8E52_002344 [Russula decolorans]